MNRYVLGFMFSRDHKRVVLIRKNKPDWQRGKFNGVGGKIEPMEQDLDAMVREYFEETGVTTIPEEWTVFCHMRGNHFLVECYCGTGNVDLVESKTDEQVVVAYVGGYDPNIDVENLAWLIPAALENLKNEHFCLTAHYP